MKLIVNAGFVIVAQEKLQVGGWVGPCPLGGWVGGWVCRPLPSKGKGAGGGLVGWLVHPIALKLWSP